MNRRTLVAGAAILPAIAIPAAAQCVLQPDAELLALGAELETLLRERYIPLARPDAERTAAFNALVEAATIGNETEEEYLAVRGRISDQQHHKKLSDGGARAEDERTDAAWDGINNDLYPLVDDILAKPAKTLPGLAVQARAISAAAEDLWAGYSGNTHEFEFICRVCQFLGVIPLHTEVHAGL
jgi:hypothetical protein